MHQQTDVLCVLGTRPEIIKFAPVIHAFEAHSELRICTVDTGQQADLISTFLSSQRISPNYALDLMKSGEGYLGFVHRVVDALIPIVSRLTPRCVVVQGDTSSAFGGAIVAANLGIPVVHVEAGLRSGDDASPYPEEALRTLITHCTSLHCAPTSNNVDNLLAEGIPRAAIHETGNPIVDAVESGRPFNHYRANLPYLQNPSDHARRIVLTFHRRENFGQRTRDYLAEVLRFVNHNEFVTVIFPVHPNPNVQAPAADILGNHPRIHLIAPLDYEQFLGLMSQSDLILSDSGGIQEETATIGVPLFILRGVTERPEAIGTGLAQLVPTPANLAQLLDRITQTGEWPRRRQTMFNPFGDGHSGERIATLIKAFLLTP